MSFVNKADQSGKINNFSVPHKGKVVKNDDPLKLGRVKCYIAGIFEDTSSDAEGLPWCFPFHPNSACGQGRPDAGFFGVPDLGSEVIIEFPFKDIYIPFFTGYWESALTTQSSIFSGNYPATYGFTDSSGTVLRIDKSLPMLEFFRKVGDLLKIDQSGNWTLNIPASMVINVGSNLQVNVGGTIASSAGSNQTHYASNDFNAGAGHNFGSCGGGGMNFQSSSAMYVKSSSEIALDGSVIHLNSGHASYSDSSSGDISALQGQVSTLQSTVQSLQSELTTLKSKVDANLPKIGKES